MLGDAAHLMSLFVGAGANLAMLDGLELGNVLSDAINGGKSVEEREAAVAAWEEKMFVGAKKFATIALQGVETGVHPDAPRSIFESQAPDDMDASNRRDG